MAGGRAIPILLLLGLVGVAHFALGWQAEHNGTFTFPYVLSYSKRVLPNTKVPIKLPQTGVAEVDNYLAFMTTFFWMALDPRNVRAHLGALYICGTLSSAWILMLGEAHRTTASLTFCLVTYLCELLGEFVGIGMFTPIWCALHLLWTAKPSSSDRRRSAEDALSAPTGTMQALGYALVFGHVIPTVLMNHMAIDGAGWESGQLWTIVRLFHPVLVLGFFVVFKTLQGITTSRHAHDSAARRFASKRKLYFFAMLASGIGHMLVMVPLFSKNMLGWMRPEVLKALDFRTLFVPISFWHGQPLAQVDFVTGVAIFLQWDNLCATAAILVWAVSLYIEGLSSHSAGVRARDVGNLVVQTVGVIALAGPVAGAAYVLQERDALIVAHAREKEGKKL